MNVINKMKIYFNHLLIIYFLIVLIVLINNAVSDEKSDININADKILISDDGNKINASGNIIIKTEKFTSSSKESNYDKELDSIKNSGNIILKDSFDNYYYFDEFITDKNFDSALGSDVKIRMNDGTRIVGKFFSRKHSSINQINNAYYTPCLQKNYIVDNCPGWKLGADKVIHDENKQTIYYQGAVLSVLNVPILYTPFFSHPDPSVKKRSGILMPSVTSDNILGTTISIPIFYNIASNHDLTFTPTLQSKVDDYYSVNYRHLTKSHKFNLDTSISSIDSELGTKNHLFIDGQVQNPYGAFNYTIRTTNNDTYMRKNQMNDLTVLENGLEFTKEMNNSYLGFNTNVYKHLNNPSNQKWEYVYPSVNYAIYQYTDPIIKQDWSINNTFLNYRDIDKNHNQQVSSEIFSQKIIVSNKTGLKFENTIQNRLIYFTDSENDFNQLRAFPQIASKISFPLIKISKKNSQLLEPLIMPIIAPYNNYANSQNISNSNIFSLNRETSLSQWESGPRVNYGLNWLINYDNFLINSTIGQSVKINKEKNIDTNEISNYFIGNTLDFGNLGYIKTDITVDRNKLYLKDNNINASMDLGEFKFGFDYDYESIDKIKTSEQISVGTKIRVFKDVNVVASIRKDLMTENSVGNAFGLHYENDCLALNLDYFRDFTSVDDIKNSRGVSFTITLKPFGTTKQRGKTRNFGPEL